jgi:hypothetical protein
LINETRDLADKGYKEAMDNLISVEDSQHATDHKVETLTHKVSKLEKVLEEAHMENLGHLEKELEKVCEDMKKQSKQHHSDLHRIQASLTDLADLSSQARSDIDATRAKIVESAEASRRESSEVELKLERIASDLRKSEAKVLERIKKVAAEEASEVQELVEKLRVTEAAVSTLDTKINQEIVSSTQKAAQAREKIRSECLGDIKQIQKDLHSVSLAVVQVANIPTRSVEWVIQEASSRLLRAGDQQPSHTGECVSLTSQRFEAGGAKGLRLELIRYAESSIDGSDIKDCSLRLFAERGLRLIFRLYIGDACFSGEHTFDGQQPFQTTRLCLLSEQIQQDDTVRVCLEVLEAVFSLEATSSFASIGVSSLYDDDDQTNDTCIFNRHVNHRMLDLVQAQVDVMNSRMTRRVEWRIEQASRLPKCFMEGEPMCSTSFQAAGLEGLQLVFYPSGYEGAKSGYCSCFLFCPGSSSLRCWLSIGNQRREAKLAFANDGFYGRTNFCRLDQCMDATSDEVVIVLEIDEAQQDVTKPLIHQTSTSQMASPRPEISVMPTSETNVDSVMRIQKASGRLEHVRQLPSIWTSKVAGDITLTLEGFHNMKDLRYKKRPNSRLLHNLSNSCERNGNCSSMSVYCDSSSPSRLSHREQTISPTPDNGNRVTTSSLSMYSDVRAPVNARPPSRNHARSNLSSKYSAYMG